MNSVPRLSFYDWFYKNLIREEMMCGNYSLNMTMLEMIRAVDSWLHQIGALPAPPRGHTLEWCLEADDHSFTQFV